MARTIRTYASLFILLGFLLGIQGGRVAIWRNDDPQPIRVFPWSTALLPAPIRQALENGIYVEDDSDIGKLIDEMLR